MGASLGAGIAAIGAGLGIGRIGSAAMEAIARKTPLSKHHRPAWDLDVLRGLGMQAAADTEVWKQVWTKEERINNASTPMFLVEGHKVGVAV